MLQYFTHWMSAVLVFTSLATGLRIATDNAQGMWVELLSPWLPQGNVILWHVWSGFALLFVLAIYLLHRIQSMYKSGVWWKTSKSPMTTLTFHLHRLLTLLLVVITLIGLYLYIGIDQTSEQTMASVHLLLAWSLLFIIISHIVAEGFNNGYEIFLSVLLPRSGSVLSLFKLITLVSLLALVFSVVISENVTQTLTIQRADKIPKLDGIDNDKVWKKAEKVIIKTVRGENLLGFFSGRDSCST